MRGIALAALAAAVVLISAADARAGCRPGLFRGRAVSVIRHVERNRVHLFPLFPRLWTAPAVAVPCAPAAPVPAPQPMPKPKKMSGLETDSGVVVISAAAGCTDCGCVDALAEVNALRASRGLRPFVHDPALTVGARAVAAFRAARGMFGHTGNDFGFLPPGAAASAAGCAAYPPEFGWMSCCTNDNATFAGAAYATGPDGKRYMHLFVR